MIKKLFLSFLIALGIGVPLFNFDKTYAWFRYDNYVLEEKENGNMKLVALKDTSSPFYYIYENSKIDEIGPNAFANATNSYSVMISNYVKIIDQSAFSNKLTTIYFTGSEQEWNDINYSTSKNVNFYACDEGFINYWNTYIRPNKDTNICETDRLVYGEMKMLYSSLSEEHKVNVDCYVDLSGSTIKDSITYLDEYFSKPVNSNVGYLPKDKTISIIIAVSVIGMTAIAGLYLLKKRNIIG